MKIEIKEASVLLTRNGSDLVSLYIDLPSAIYPYDEGLALDFKAARGTGVEYVRKHFGIEPKVIQG